MAVMFFSTAAAILLFDLWSKWHVSNHPPPGGRAALVPGLIEIINVKMNEGAAFGLGKGMAPLFVLVSLLASAAMVWVAFRYGRSSRLLTVALGLLLGGALGNVWDRLFCGGKVRDFIDLYIGKWRYPATFNVADAAICFGCGMVFLYSFRKPKKKTQEKGTTRERKKKRGK